MIVSYQGTWENSHLGTFEVSSPTWCFPCNISLPGQVNDPAPTLTLHSTIHLSLEAQGRKTGISESTIKVSQVKYNRHTLRPGLILHVARLDVSTPFSSATLHVPHFTHASITTAIITPPLRLKSPPKPPPTSCGDGLLLPPNTLPLLRRPLITRKRQRHTELPMHLMRSPQLPRSSREHRRHSIHRGRQR